MRILAVEPGPAFSVQDVHRGWVDALLRLGCTVADLNYGDRLDFYSQVALKKRGRWQQAMQGEDAVRAAAKGLQAVVYEFWPDIILITSCFFVPNGMLDLFRARGHKVVINFTESPYEDDSQIAKAAHADLCLINDPTNLERFREVNPNTHYQPHSYAPLIHHPRPANADYKSDIAFVGTGFESRIGFLEQTDWDGIDLLLAGNWQRLTEDSPLRRHVAHNIEHCIDNIDAVDVYSSTKASFNLYRVESERPGLEHGWSCGPREIELAATGCWFARQTRPESDELFPMLPTFETPVDLGEILRWALANDDKRNTAATKARAAIAERTFDAAAARLLQLVAP